MGVAKDAARQICPPAWVVWHRPLDSDVTAIVQPGEYAASPNNPPPFR
jgi:hypothetical protein